MQQLKSSLLGFAQLLGSFVVVLFLAQPYLHHPSRWRID